ncbi:glutathione-dependent formaldehyde-activating protein [Rhizoctonia solani AG-3 Rhs1AP]|uniref:Glutathione-dependent formaldehyde-activating protein n=2 Tax=Rhizoctonia solani AG-3 TaxID=1086053 RepID=A0A074S6D5_9AGAM|nr:glutathione-dependent formaldehyde-activating protein [Rhizoctonia solani AG-3 Rhs1AP]KEP54759.1 glutathione-dependent formaldehyde-activating protein [Rhizoctonia solani 123E]
MPIELKGSCHCGAVKFRCQSNTPVPYQLCQCSICRKVGGYMGSVNIMGLNKSLSIEGESNLKSYSPKHSETGEPLTSKRFFCQICGSMLWLHDPSWDEWVYPFASAIDTPLPKAEKTLAIMRSSCPEYIPVPEGSAVLEKYNDQGIEQWHKSHGAWVD